MKKKDPIVKEMVDKYMSERFAMQRANTLQKERYFDGWPAWMVGLFGKSLRVFR